MLKNKGYQLAVVSNISQPYTQALYSLLPHTFDYEVLSCNVGAHKPHKKIFQSLLNIADIKSKEVVMVGDNLYVDVQGAKKADIDSIHLDRSSRRLQQHKEYISIAALDQLLDIL